MYRKKNGKFWFKVLGLMLSGLMVIAPVVTLSAEPIKGDSNSKDKRAPNTSVMNTQKSPFVPGDAVFISTFPDTTSFLNNIFPIDDRGYVELPILGKVKISQMSEAEFKQFLKENFQDYLRYPYIYIKPMIRVSVLGGVFRPNFYYVDPHQSLWEVLYMAGGTIDEDGLKQMRWERDGKVIEDNLIPYLQNGTSLKAMGFRSGDQIWVRTPTKPTLVEEIMRYTPLVTMAVTITTLWLTYQRTFYFRR